MSHAKKAKDRYEYAVQVDKAEDLFQNEFPDFTWEYVSDLPHAKNGTGKLVGVKRAHTDDGRLAGEIKVVVHLVWGSSWNGGSRELLRGYAKARATDWETDEDDDSGYVWIKGKHTKHRYYDNPLEAVDDALELLKMLHESKVMTKVRAGIELWQERKQFFDSFFDHNGN